MINKKLQFTLLVTLGLLGTQCIHAYKITIDNQSPHRIKVHSIPNNTTYSDMIRSGIPLPAPLPRKNFADGTFEVNLQDGKNLLILIGNKTWVAMADINTDKLIIKGNIKHVTVISIQKDGSKNIQSLGETPFDTISTASGGSLIHFRKPPSDDSNDKRWTKFGGDGYTTIAPPDHSDDDDPDSDHSDDDPDLDYSLYD